MMAKGPVERRARAVSMPTKSVAGASVGAECTVARGGIVRGSFVLQADTHGEGTRALGGIGV